MGAYATAPTFAVDRRAYSLFRIKERRPRRLDFVGGEQQMCAVARGLMSNPKLLLIDEHRSVGATHCRSAGGNADRCGERWHRNSPGRSGCGGSADFAAEGFALDAARSCPRPSAVLVITPACARPSRRHLTGRGLSACCYLMAEIETKPAPRKSIGLSMPRADTRRLVAARRYVDDCSAKGELHAAFLQPFPHAEFSLVIFRPASLAGGSGAERGRTRAGLPSGDAYRTCFSAWSPARAAAAGARARAIRRTGRRSQPRPRHCRRRARADRRLHGARLPAITEPPKRSGADAARPTRTF